ncbi:RIB43A-like with coiled-coils protein 2 [Araneus ventricosus]|uniref:RIB43A-like with coiled-coils protein 2 n=1 Tax=Araneus ventricosus TaxID=182803 RepID=A0A4Y2CLS2_ARAVE|nr:RIB43A-like with coiled-coils protein 2 [Araneus ventricosus]
MFTCLGVMYTREYYPLGMSADQRRLSEKFRKRIIFNAKQRQIGLDIETLNQQVHENHLERIKNAEYEKNLAEETRKYDALALAVEEQRRQNMRDQCKQIDEFRLSVQRPENSRDFDLFDPNLKKKEKPPRISCHDICPISGIQRLEGEDLDYETRMKKQKQQVHDVLLEQMLEQQMQRLNFKKAEHDWESSLLQQDNYAKKLLLSEMDDRKSSSSHLANDNKHLAWQKQEINRQQKIREEYENRKDIEFHYYGDMLTENPSVAKNLHQSHRILPDRWKGMSKAQLQDIYRGQVYQMEKNQVWREREQQKKKEWDEFILGQQQMFQLLDSAEKRTSQELSKKLEIENQEIAQQQKQYREYFNKVINSNIPSEQYFAQFNTTSR